MDGVQLPSVPEQGDRSPRPGLRVAERGLRQPRPDQAGALGRLPRDRAADDARGPEDPPRRGRLAGGHLRTAGVQRPRERRRDRRGRRRPRSTRISCAARPATRTSPRSSFFGFRDDGLRTGFQAALQRAGRHGAACRRGRPRGDRGHRGRLCVGARAVEADDRCDRVHAWRSGPRRPRLSRAPEGRRGCACARLRRLPARRIAATRAGSEAARRTLSCRDADRAPSVRPELARPAGRRPAWTSRSSSPPRRTRAGAPCSHRTASASP